MRKSLILAILALSFASNSQAATSVTEWTFECTRTQRINPELAFGNTDRIVLKVSPIHLKAATYSFSGKKYDFTVEWEKTELPQSMVRPVKDNCSHRFGRDSVSYNSAHWAAQLFVNFCVDSQMLEGKDGNLHLEYPMGSKSFHSFSCK